jgi:hypothetical protein
MRTLATPLLLLLASGARLDTILTTLRPFASQIRAPFEWMKAKAQCSTTQLEELATRLPELRRRKADAVRQKNFPVAAELRGRELATFESVGLRPTFGRPSSASEETIENQMEHFSALLHRQCPK